MADPTPADPVAARMAEIRERSERPLGPGFGSVPITNDAVRRLMGSAADVPPLLAALEAVLAEHEPEPGVWPPVCRACRTDPQGWGRDEWPCRTYRAISRKLLGSEEGSDHGQGHPRAHRNRLAEARRMLAEAGMM